MSQKIISFHYTLTDSDGVLVESSQGRDPVSFMTDMGMIVPGLEREIVHYSVGQKGRVEVKAEEAYGLIDFAKYVKVPREALPKQEIKVGDMFQSNQSPIPFTVKEMAEDHVILDGNHPLAGEDLVFDVEVLEMRDASEQELQQLQEMMQAAQQQQQQAQEQAGQPPEATA
ncbi:MAG: FKBP-type peptidyl-prolyl cis-trans isomerase [Verrucomicrobia bacterium]|nr:FKBP-type peptidyl-prolyl cis-trans isomerase [Verrucomicrobiota bacterium]